MLRNELSPIPVERKPKASGRTGWCSSGHVVIAGSGRPRSSKGGRNRRAEAGRNRHASSSSARWGKSLGYRSVVDEFADEIIPRQSLRWPDQIHRDRSRRAERSEDPAAALNFCQGPYLAGLRAESRRHQCLNPKRSPGLQTPALPHRSGQTQARPSPPVSVGSA